jgi:tRNA A37 threonylcarbamoyladenosine dehydratase
MSPDEHAYSGTDLERRFGGIARLYGESGAARLRGAHVAVIGLGGVGSWAAEALARSSIGQLTLIDYDHIAESNTNRQIQALGGAYGRSKIEAMAERIAAINPACKVQCIDEFVTPDNADRLIIGFDAVLDCIDQVHGKAALIARGRLLSIRVYTCGAAGGRIDPTQIACADLALASGDPLLASVRHRLRRKYGFPAADATGKHSAVFGVTAIYSPEPVRRPPSALEAAEDQIGRIEGNLACSGYGSSVVVTAAMGMMAAGKAMASLAQDRANID